VGCRGVKRGGKEKLTRMLRKNGETQIIDNLEKVIEI
jgi:hypothetical protein